MLAFWKFIGDLRVRHKNIINLSLKSIIMLLVIAYIGYVIKVFIDKGSPVDWCYGYGMAFIILILTLWCIIYYKAIKISCKLMSPYFVRNFGKTIRNIKSRLKTFKITLAVIFIVAFCAFVIYDTRSDPRRLISLFGIVFFILVGLIFSKHPNYIRWDTVVTGVSLHLLIGFLTMKVEAGRNIFQCVGLTIVRFLEYGYNGAEFIFGDFLVNKQHVFAFQSLSVLFFLSMVMQILFHLGWIQVFCFKLGGFLQRLLGTTVIESVNAVSTIFLGMSEAPLLYRPYVKDLTPSEIHCVMTAGFATVAGTLLAAYTNLGVDPKNVVTASALAAPSSLMFAKLFYPENQVSKTSSDSIAIYKSSDISVMDAACKGAFAAIELINAIIACVAASVSMVYFVNGISLWLGSLAGVEGLTIEYLLGKIFIPLAWVMGVRLEQCQDVASLIGLKTFANEFVAYEKLGKLKAAGKLSVRSEAIATFALCGFANPGALATLIALLSSICPLQRSIATKVAFRALAAGSITSFTSACIAGVLTPENGFGS
ncbi:concentrative nucleoside transporter 2 isoform X2 [Rhodnius prolixus]